MSSTLLPVSDDHMEQVSLKSIIQYGLSMHVATAWGSARASGGFRARYGRKWLPRVVKRFCVEYGLNLALLAIIQPLIFMFVHDWKSILIAETIALVSLPLLSVLQMLVDYIRNDCNMYRDTRTNAGLSVKVHSRDADGNVVSWAFLNHYALPVGHRKGIALRKALHSQAKDNRITLTCYAQNEDVARYYLEEHPGGKQVDGARPLLTWDYSEGNGADIVVGNKFDPLGFSSMRNSGQLPLWKSKSS